MSLLISGAMVFRDGGLVRADVSIEGGRIARIADSIPSVSHDITYHFPQSVLIPGLVDVHVHLREPGFSYKETIRTGTLAAARGGYTALCAMPNLSPAPDTMEHLGQQLDIIRRDAAVRVYPFGTITMGQQGAGQLSEIEQMSAQVCGFSDDGRGVQDDELMRRAMRAVKDAGSIISAHCEDDSELLAGGAVHDRVAARFGAVGISAKSEWAMIERDIALVRETGCRYHVCHVSTRESVALIRQAKAQGLDISCETAPHYLLLTDELLKDEGRFKMNPPIRSAQDRDALIEGLLDRTIDMIATDHAPHSAEEKGKGLIGSAMGIVGIETAFPLMYTHLVKTGILGFDQLMDLMALAPRRRFRIPGGQIEVGQPADLALMDLNDEYAIDSSQFLSMGKSTPFEGMRVQGRTLLTMVEGEVRYAVSG